MEMMREDDKNIKVELPGHGTFWFLRMYHGGGALAPLHHCDDKGNVTAEAVEGLESLQAMFDPNPRDDESYAYVGMDGVIRRLGTRIGTVNDLIEVKNDHHDVGRSDG